MAKPQLVFVEDGYQIVVGKIESEVTDFGDMCELSTGGKTLYALVDLADGEDAEPESMLGEHWILEGKPVDCDIVPLAEELADGDTDED